MRVSLTFLAILICLIIPPILAADVSEKEAVLKACANQFGESIDVRQNLFSVNRFYVLRASFNGRGKLAELAIEPRYFFEQSHPEWSEPADFTCLAKSEYDHLLVLLDRIRPKGRLVKGRESISYVTNMTARHTERYEHATLIWGEVVDSRLGDNPPLKVRWLRLISSRPRSTFQAALSFPCHCRSSPPALHSPHRAFQSRSANQTRCPDRSP
jgi:hypothetical protein